MEAALIVIGCFCFMIWVSNPGVLGNIFIWIIALAASIAAAHWLGFGGFLLVGGLAGWIAFSASSARQHEIDSAEEARLRRLRRQRKNWMHY